MYDIIAYFHMTKPRYRSRWSNRLIRQLRPGSDTALLITAEERRLNQFGTAV